MLKVDKDGFVGMSKTKNRPEAAISYSVTFLNCDRYGIMIDW